MCKLSENNKELKNGKSGRQPHRQGVKVSGHEGQRSGLKGSKSSGSLIYLHPFDHQALICTVYTKALYTLYIYILHACVHLYICVCYMSIYANIIYYIDSIYIYTYYVYRA